MVVLALKFCRARFSLSRQGTRVQVDDEDGRHGIAELGNIGG